jgi:glycosyltransferase involved in cell wall biosynthesis
MIPNNSNSSKRIQRVVYVTSVDISLPNGPGVNEYEFVIAAYEKWGENFATILPRPIAEITLPVDLKVLWSSPRSYTNPVLFYRHQIAVYSHLKHYIKEASPDLIVLRRAPFSFGLLLALKSQFKPYVVKTASGFPEAIWRSQTGIRRLAMWLLKPIQLKLDKMLFQGAIAIDACTTGHAQGIAKNYSVSQQKIIVVDNATNIKRFYPQNSLNCRNDLALASFKPVIGYVGGRPWERGATHLIKVLPELRDSFPNVGVLIVGGGNDQKMDNLKQLASHLGVAGHVVFTGVIPYEIVPKRINCLDVGVAFDRVDTNAKGNSNQKIRQYLACGVPVITSTDGNEYLTDAGLGFRLSDPDDLVSLKNALIELMSMDSNTRSQFQDTARDFAVEHLSTKRALEERIKFWHQRISEEGKYAQMQQ